MTIDNTTEQIQTQPEPIPGTWGDLLLYTFGIFGLFVVGSLLLTYPFLEEDITLTVSILATLANVFFIGGGTYLFGIRRRKITWANLGISPPVWKNIYFLSAFLVVVVLMPIRGVIGTAVEYLVNGDFESLEMRQELLGAGMDSWPGFLLMLVMVGVLAPIAEELYFRGLIYNWFRQRWGVGLSVFVSSAWFAFGHIDSVGVMASGFVMGAVIALAYEKTKSLWIAITMHVFTNSIAVVLLYLATLAEQYLTY
jgi:hypothetical protein